MKEEKISFLKRVVISLKDFEKYRIFAEEKLSKSIKYIFFITIILMIFIALSFTVKYGILINNCLNYIKSDLPEFTYENGNLKFDIESPLIIENGDTHKNVSYKFIIDTSDEVSNEKINEYKEQTGLYNYGILFLKDKVIINSTLNNRRIEQSYSDMQANYGIIEKFNKEDLVKYLNDQKIYTLYIEIFAFLYIYLFASYFITMLLDALLIAILGIITAWIVRVKIKFKGVYAMALHAITLSIILNVMYVVVNTFTGFYIKYFDVMYTTISYIYIVAAILSIRQDLIKQQIEIGTINEKNERKDEEYNEQEEQQEQE